jgi:outer membrane receptor protein involved in Fe transport
MIAEDGHSCRRNDDGAPVGLQEAMRLPGSQSFDLRGETMKISLPASSKRRSRSAFIIATLLATTSIAHAAVTADAPEEANRAASDSSDIVVTAQRRDEAVSKVPISIATYSQAQMDTQGIRKIDDISRLTPALNFSASSGVNANTSTNISIRGVASDVGSATTAIYIDDTPIQIRNITYLGGNPYPRVFDLERVEVLRGPQGTLFGASAEGGAVRFITPQPSFTDRSVYGRAEVSTTDKGGESYEAGLALGGPLSETLALRVSAWYRKDGGYIDQATQGTNTIIAKDVNSQKTIVARAALAWRPVEQLTITPSVFFQRLDVRAQDQYWEGYGNAANGDYVTGVHHLEPTEDRIIQPALKFEYDFGNVVFVSNTSYFKRDLDQHYSYTTYQSFLRSGNPLGTFANKFPDNSDLFLTSKQTNLVQEARLFSTDGPLINWMAGVYYSRTKQDFQNFTGSGRIPGVLAGGLPQLQGRYSYSEEIHANDEQIAGYANVDITPLDRLKISISGRFTHNKFDFQDITDGPTVGNIRTTVDAAASENSFTPKVTASFQATPSNLLYATASKGFRPGGAQPAVSPEFCARDLALLGLTRSPTAYASDSLWNYEAGTKNKFFDNKLQIDVSAYLIKWKNIQQSINLPFCNLNFVGNLGSATGKGVELSAAVTPVEGVQFGANLAYTHISFDSSQFIGTNRLVANGQRFGGPKWTGAVFAQVDRPIDETTTLYGRVDYSFATDKSAPSLPGSFGFDPDLLALPNTNFVSLRAGARLNGVDLSLFVDNLTNSKDMLARNHDGFGGSLYYIQTYRPRTIGLTAQYRY